MGVEAADAVVTTDLAVGGMTCAACVKRVEKRLAGLDGVTATVNLATGRARVSHPPTVTPADLVTTVEQAGYTAELPEPHGRRNVIHNRTRGTNEHSENSNSSTSSGSSS